MTHQEPPNGGRLARTARNRENRNAPGSGIAAGPTTLTAVTRGIAAGVAGLAAFLVLHAAWIVPIWSVATIGLVIALPDGAAVGWAYRQVEPDLPDGRIRQWLALTGGAVIILSPSLVVAWVGEPYFVVVDGVRVATGSSSTVAVRFVVEFLLVTTISGALVGWFVTRTRRGTVAVAVAGFAFALGPGHNLPFFHVATAPTAARTAVLLTLVPIVVASAAFVAADAFLQRRETPA